MGVFGQAAVTQHNAALNTNWNYNKIIINQKQVK
jgi:hypothetical protein